MIDAKGIAHLMEEAGDPVATGRFPRPNPHRRPLPYGSFEMEPHRASSFSEIHWAGEPLDSYQKIVHFI